MCESREHCSAEIPQETMMTIKADIDLKAAFDKRDAAEQAPIGDVPERIKKHAPTPVLRPDGSMRRAADAVDQRVREAEDAAKAEREWAAPRDMRRGFGMGYSFARSIDDD
jgi:hypothetical protein